MSSNKQVNFDDQEIDLTMVSNKVSGFFQSINRSIFLMIQFVLKHKLIIGFLLIFGIGIGLYLDKTQKIYRNELIVRPNFESTDYVYSKVELLKSKIKENDTLFLKSIGIQNPSKLISIEITPIIDIYKFISSTSTKDNDQNFQLLKLLAEDGDMKTIVTEKATSKNYTFHKITFITRKLTNRKETIDPILKYLENSVYYSNLKNVYTKSNYIKLNRYNEIIAQIDAVLNNFSNEKKSTSNNNNLVYYNENTQLNDVIQTKNYLISEIGRIQYDLQISDKIVKENSTTLNILDTKSIKGKLKYILPLLFIFMYVSFYFFVNFYKKQSLYYAKEQI